MSSFLRESKIRQVVISLAPRETYYEQLKVSNVANENNGLTANDRYLAYIDSGGGGSAVAVLPLNSVGKNHIPTTAPTYQQPLIRAHSQPVTDISFDPFNSLQLYTCSGDRQLKVWAVPQDGYVVDAVEPTISLSHTSALKEVVPHVSAAGVVACRGVREIPLFSIESGSCCRLLEGFNGELQSLCWSNLGDILCCTTKEKDIVFADMRSPEISSTSAAHANHRSSRVAWMGDSHNILSCAFSAMLDREVALWDARNMSSPVCRQRIDSSTGALMPFYDSDLNFVVLAGKGDTSVRVYDFECSNDTGSMLHPIINTPLGDPATTKGAAVLPKQVNNLMGCEVLRFLRLTENSVQPVSFTVPRRERLKYHGDLFPNTTNLAPPSLRADEWLSGAAAPRCRVPISPPSAPAAASRPSLTTGETDVDNAEDQESPNSTTNSSDRQSRRSLTFGPKLKFRHLYGKEAPRDQTFFNLCPSVASMEGPLLACSGEFWAVPWKGAGGAVYVSRIDSPGKVDSTPPVICGHRGPVLDLAFSPFHENVLATASDDSHVKIWRIPETGLQSSLDSDAASADYNKHTSSVRCLRFHPRSNNLLASASLDSTVRIWDVESCSDVCVFAVDDLQEGASVSNLDFNYSGYSMLAACKDRTVRFIDPRAGVMYQKTPDNALGRNLRAAWCDTPAGGAVVTTFMGSSGRRQIQAWDPRNMTTPQTTQVIDSASGTLYPMFDEDTGLCMVVGKGDTIIRFYELSFLSSSFTFLKSCDYSCTPAEPISGACVLPKSLCDYRNVEVSKILKLTESSVAPVSFILPRAETLKSYFQDDLFPPTRRRSSNASIAAWISGDESTLPPPEMVSLRPDDMELLSSKPAEEPVKQKVEIFRETINKEEEESRKREEAFNRLQELAIQRSKYHVNLSMGDNQKAEDGDSDDGWDD